MNKIPLTAKDSSIAFVSSFVICNISALLFSMIALYIGAICGVSNLENFSQSCIGNLIAASGMFTSMFLLYIFFTKKKDNKILSKPTTSKTFIYLGIAIISFFVLCPIINSFDYWLSLIGIKPNGIAFKLNTTNYFISIIPMVILPAICEELLFRGLIFKGLSKHGKVISLTITTLMFTIYHMSISQTLYPILFGLLLTFVMLKENNIFYCILMHFTNNLLALTTQYFNIVLFTPKLWFFIISFILFAIFITILLIAIKKAKSTENSQKLNKTDKIFIIVSIIIMFIFWILSNIIS